MKKNKNPKLTVIGAGPGDPDLITLKAVKALASANVVLYDALVNTELLQHAPDAVKIFVGKRYGKHSCKQDSINTMIVNYAFKHGHVIRLKGGDPFIFGRGLEELSYADSLGIETEVISGISSSSAVPASVGIPLTHRGVAESVWIITGTTKKHKLSYDVYLAAKSVATVVILMGMNKINQIVSIFEKEGKKDTPIAIIQNGTTKDEKIGIGTIETIIDEVHAKQISNPAVIVIGEVVKESIRLKSFYEEIHHNKTFLNNHLIH
ncbi:MAG: uroporphyrinogen-III C-methyltransferase [Flavobacteriales bacterium]